MTINEINDLCFIGGVLLSFIYVGALVCAPGCAPPTSHNSYYPPRQFNPIERVLNNPERSHDTLLEQINCGKLDQTAAACLYLLQITESGAALSISSFEAFNHNKSDIIAAFNNDLKTSAWRESLFLRAQNSRGAFLDAVDDYKHSL